MKARIALAVVVFAGCDVSDPTYFTIDGSTPPTDTGVIDHDAGAPADTGPDLDSGPRPLDGAIPDASAPDAAGRDAQPRDAGRLDAQAPDAFVPDTGPMNSGECVLDSDCGPDAKCVELTDGGYRVCQFRVDQAMGCTGTVIDQCCESSQCNGGICVLSPVIPICTGVAEQPHNVCADGFCNSDGDCAQNSICIPAGVFGRKVKSCFAAVCRVDSDCNDLPGGTCEPIPDPCCGFEIGLACVYPPSGCRSNADCPNGHCQYENGRTECIAGPPVCPL